MEQCGSIPDQRFPAFLLASALALPISRLASTLALPMLPAPAGLAAASFAAVSRADCSSERRFFASSAVSPSWVRNVSTNLSSIFFYAPTT
ncbi:MAG: hypothetical protein K2N29_03805, partial [Ruminiclostridium sp.]|nr:hypothetical protein [Ruminiclostridium sp.]